MLNPNIQMKRVSSLGPSSVIVWRKTTSDGLDPKSVVQIF